MASLVERCNEELLVCARYGELEELKEELGKGADVNFKGEGGKTALHAACANGHEAIVDALLAAGADATATNDAGNTPGHYAASQRHAGCLRKIVATAGADVLARNEFGRSCLTEAIASGDGAVATIALEHGSAAEEKIIEGLGVETGPAEVEHALALSPPRTAGEKAPTVIRVREKVISTGARDDALGDGDGATDRTGLAIWAAALVLGRWLADKASDFDGKSVVELGAGCGVGALALAAACKTCRVVATDAAPETLANLEHNAALFAADFPDDDDHDAPRGGRAPLLGVTARVGTAGLDWAEKRDARCDVVVGADLVYHEAVVDILAKTVERTGCAEFWYAAPSTGRAGGDAFLAKLERLGFEHVAKAAPPSYAASPLADAEAGLLYFPDLASTAFTLHRFVRPFKG